jgi:hypothetical protein
MGACGSKPKGAETLKPAVKGPTTGPAVAALDKQLPVEPKLANIANNQQLGQSPMPAPKDGGNIDEMLNKYKKDPVPTGPVEVARPLVVSGPSKEDEELKLKKKRDEALRYMQEHRMEEPRSQIHRDEPIIVTEKIAVTFNK